MCLTCDLLPRSCIRPGAGCSPTSTKIRLRIITNRSTLEHYNMLEAPIPCSVENVRNSVRFFQCESPTLQTLLRTNMQKPKNRVHNCSRHKPQDFRTRTTFQDYQSPTCKEALEKAQTEETEMLKTCNQLATLERWHIL